MSTSDFFALASTITLGGSVLYFFLWGAFQKERFRTMMIASSTGALGLGLLSILIEHFS